MINVPENELFVYWENHGLTPERLLDNYGARLGLTMQDKEQLQQVLRYAVNRERKALERVLR